MMLDGSSGSKYLEAGTGGRGGRMRRIPMVEEVLNGVP